jgi:hypothetical protein
MMVRSRHSRTKACCAISRLGILRVDPLAEMPLAIASPLVDLGLLEAGRLSAG